MCLQELQYPVSLASVSSNSERQVRVSPDNIILIDFAPFFTLEKLFVCIIRYSLFMTNAYITPKS